MKPLLPTFVDFFAGSGLVTQGVKHACAPVWANDNCPRKAAIYTANHGAGHFHPGSIEDVTFSHHPFDCAEGRILQYYTHESSGFGN